MWIALGVVIGLVIAAYNVSNEPQLLMPPPIECDSIINAAQNARNELAGTVKLHKFQISEIERSHATKLGEIEESYKNQIKTLSQSETALMCALKESNEEIAILSQRLNNGLIQAWTYSEAPRAVKKSFHHRRYETNFGKNPTWIIRLDSGLIFQYPELCKVLTNSETVMVCYKKDGTVILVGSDE